MALITSGCVAQVEDSSRWNYVTCMSSIKLRHKVRSHSPCGKCGLWSEQRALITSGCGLAGTRC